MKLGDICPNIFVINLERRLDRRLFAQEQMKKFGFNGIFSVATDARDISNPTRLRDGEYALLLSHKKVIEQAKIQGLESVIVFEDDFECVTDFNERLVEFEEIPKDWDLVYLGANNWHCGAGTILPVRISENIMKVFTAFTTHAMLIKNTLYDFILNEIDKQKEPLDVIYTRAQQQFNAYCFVRNLCKQWDNFSDIIGFNPEYNKMGVYD